MKPRLTRHVIEGLRYVLMDAEAMLAERQGWGEEAPQDDAEERGLLYLGQLIEWADERCKVRRERHVRAPQGQPRVGRVPQDALKGSNVRYLRPRVLRGTSDL